MEKFKTWATKPPLGWNSWDCFGAAVTEQQIRENADYMAKYLKPYGWEYVVCNIQWYEPKAYSNDYNNFTELEMDEYGRLMPAVNRFPSAADGRGFTTLAEYIHSLGLKFGIHIMRGVPRQAVAQNCPIYGSDSTCRDIAHHFSVCSWNTDMYGVKNCDEAQEYYNSIINMYASWGVDFIKCDDICVTEFRRWDNPYSADYEIEMLRKAIDNCGREIVLSLSPGPALRDKADHLCANANMWRLTGDFWDVWDKLYDMFDRCKQWEGVTDTGNFPDCDMLPIGRIAKNSTYYGANNRMSQFTKPEHYTLMTLWGIFRSPLMIGGNLPENDEFTFSLLTNSEYMKMNQNSTNARELCREGDKVIWVSDGDGCKYAALFNTGDTEQEVAITFDEKGEYSVLDIWQNEELGTIKNTLKASVAPHGARLFKLV